MRMKKVGVRMTDDTKGGVTVEKAEWEKWVAGE